MKWVAVVASNTVFMAERKHTYRVISSMTKWFPSHYQPYISEPEKETKNRRMKVKTSEVNEHDILNHVNKQNSSHSTICIYPSGLLCCCKNKFQATVSGWNDYWCQKPCDFYSIRTNRDLRGRLSGCYDFKFNLLLSLLQCDFRKCSLRVSRCWQAFNFAHTVPIFGAHTDFGYIPNMWNILL